MHRPGRYYIIEHPNKGVLKELKQVGDKIVPQFSRTARLNSPKLFRFTDLQEAVKVADGLVESKGRRLIIPVVRKAPIFTRRCWDCGGWVDIRTGRELGHRRGCPHIGGGD